MDLIAESVKKMEELVENCGCEEGDVLLSINPDIVNCQYERGACMVATFGGKTAEFVTDNPVTALTKLSFLFGASFETPRARSAAGAVLNALTGFFSLSRVQHSCPPSCHPQCLELTRKNFGGKRFFCAGDVQLIPSEFRNFVVSSPEEADIFLFTGEGIIDRGSGDIIGRFRERKRIVCLGPSAAGIARINGIEHWCPFGK
ncbi:MAG TPA: hypothetical protein VLY83_01500 [Methanoregula sp.]|nr:hypothetical protein [Methanoregula sp.]